MATKRAKGTAWGLRFRTPSGERVYERLGSTLEGMTRQDADQAAKDLLARVRLGIYRTRAELQREREEREAQRVEVPPFDAFAKQWFDRRCELGGRSGKGLSESGRADLRNILDQHLLPWFGGFRLDEINVEEVDAYAAAKRREGRIGPTYLNKTLATLRAILRDAVRYGRIPRNPAEDVRVASARFNGSYLDSADAHRGGARRRRRVRPGAAACGRGTAGHCSPR